MSYDARFFARLRDGARASAREIAPIIVSLARPRSVVDVGCGTGGWLAEFKALGVEDVLGIDSSDVPADLLELPADEFICKDIAQPFTLDRTFDLALCLEVAEHLPASVAESFVASLTALAPVVVFSAAVPGQGGTGHINEQWPAYWIELFSKRGFQPVDAIRARVWENPNVAWWYAQNTFVFVSEKLLQSDELLRAAHAQGRTLPTALVHPHAFTMIANLATWRGVRDRLFARLLGKSRK